MCSETSLLYLQKERRYKKAVPKLTSQSGHISTDDLLHPTTSNASGDTSRSVCTDKNPWDGMYRKDKYARDRVLKSARLLLPFIKDDDLILDVGCFTQEASKYYPPWVRYLGIDEKAYHPQTRVVGLNHGFEPIPCSHVLCLETLEHLLDPQDTIDSIKASVAESGMIVVSLPNEATLFHRIRCLLGTVDAGCFSAEGKHLHLPSLRQARGFFQSSQLDILKEVYYISPTACGSSAQWLGRILSLIPECIHQSLADRFPSMFARGFIFLLKKRSVESPHQTAQPQSVS